MPQDLAALLVEEGAVSQADMERALARQAERGGALDSALLELELIGEGHLRSFLSHASGLPAVPPGALREIDPRARRVFPAKVAERHRLAPFAIDGRELSVAAVHPIDQAAVDEIGFMLSLTLVPHVATEWQVHDLIQRLYGGQLPARLARLAESEQRKAAEAAPPETPVPVARITPPPPEAPPPKPSVPPPASKSLEDAFFAAGESGTFVPAPEVAAPPPAESAPADETSFAGLDETPPPEGVPEPEVPPEAPPSPEPAPEPPASGGADEASFGDIEPERKAPSGFARGTDEPAEPLLAALELAVDAYDALWADATPEPAAQHHAEEAAAADAEAPPAVPPAAVEPAAAPVAEAEAAPPPVEEPAPEEPEEPEPPPPRLDRSAPPRWSIDDARAALAASVHRDEVVLTALRYARDFFEFSALFAVTRDAVVGHDALGPEESARLHARGSAIYAEDPGVVRTVLETRAPYLGPVVRDAVGTTNILDGLWRGTPRTVLLYPVLVGDRAVAVLYADNGEAPVSARRLGDLLLFLSTVGGAFERIIRAHKKRRPRGGRRAAPAAVPPPPPPAPVADAIPEPVPSWMAPPPDSAPAVEERSDAAVRAAESAPPPPAEVPPPAEPAEDLPPPVAEAGPGEAVAEPEPPPVAAALEPLELEPLEPEPEPEPQAEAEASPAPVSAPDAGSPVEEAIALLLAGGNGPPDRVAPIVELLLSSEPGVAEEACEALARHRGHAAVKPVPERLRRGLLSGVGERPVLAARALGALRDVESIPILIQAFEGGSADGAQAAADALARITLQRLGPSAQKWLRWWKENRGRSRAEWLFAALTSADRDLRVAAAEELRAAAETPVTYSPDLPSAELEAAARSWWVWWSRQGVRL